MLNAKNFWRNCILEAARCEVIFGVHKGNRKQRRAAMARERTRLMNTGSRLEKVNNILASNVDWFGDRMVTLHPTRGYRSMSPKRLEAQTVMMHKFGMVA